MMHSDQRPENPGARMPYQEGKPAMTKFLLWLILLVLCWPLALLALVVYPFVWLLLIPFKIVGIAVGGILAFVKGLILLPARLLGGPRPA